MNPKEKLIAESLRFYGFGATIEVTNGIDSSSCGSKAGQALHAKEYLDNLTRREVRVATGLAYLVSSVKHDDPRKINVMININRYNASMLEVILRKLTDVSGLSRDEAKLIDKMLKKKDYNEWELPGFLSPNKQDLKEYAKYLGVSNAHYKKCLPNIKGFTMELYVEGLFEDEIVSRQTFHRHRFRYSGSRSDADVIIACKPGNFYNAVANLNRRPHITARILTRKR